MGVTAAVRRKLAGIESEWPLRASTRRLIGQGTPLRMRRLEAVARPFATVAVIPQCIEFFAEIPAAATFLAIF